MAAESNDEVKLLLSKLQVVDEKQSILDPEICKDVIIDLADLLSQPLTNVQLGKY